MKILEVVGWLVASLLTSTALGQIHSRAEHIGWIESEAHPTPGTSPAVIQADIAAGSSYVFIDDSTKKAVKATVMPSAANPSPAGQHLQILGSEMPGAGQSLFYVMAVIYDQKALEQKANVASEAQGKKEAEEKKQADLVAAQKDAAKRTGFGPERTYRGWVLRDGVGSGFGAGTGFLEEGTNNIWYANDEKGSSFYLSPRVSQHVEVTAKLYTEFEVTHNGTFTRTRLIILKVLSELNDNAQPPPGAVRKPETYQGQNTPVVSKPKSDLRDPCSLLTSAEISSVLNRQDIGEGRLSPDHHEPNTCIWNTQPYKYPDAIRLQVISVADFKAFEADLSKVSGGAKEEGIGDDAFSVNNRGNFASHGPNIGQHSELYVLKGNTAFLVMTGGPAIPSVVPTLVVSTRALALKVASKL